MSMEFLEVLVRVAAILWAGLLITYLRSRITQAQEEKVRYSIEVAVRAAEQLFPEPGSGEQKKDWVLGYVLDRFRISRDDAERLLEAFVYELKNG